METLFIFAIKSSGLIGMFYLAYYFLLRKETFFNSNRWFLLAGLITSVVLPLVVFTKIIWVDPSPTNFDWSKVPVTTAIENDTFEINWYLVFGIVYSIGILIFLLKFAFDFYSLSKVLKGKTIQQQADFKFIDVTENISPFSYFDYIVYNSSLYSDTELENILEHEKVHSSQNHTVDVLISRLFCVVFWYNPFVWLYKKAIVQNLEFIADSEASKKLFDKKAYQLTLLKITTHENCVAITNHFYQSLIKKRIVMLNKNQSNKSNSWKYALVLPLLGAFVFFFQVKVVAQEKVESKSELSKKENILGIIIENTNKDELLNYFSKFIKNEKGIDIKFGAIKRDDNNKIIAITINSDNNYGQKITHKTENDSPIKSIKISIKKNNLGHNYLTFEEVNIDEIKNAPKGYTVTSISEGKKTPVIEKDLNSWTIDNATNEGKECLIVINGQKQSKNNKIKIPLDEEILSENKLNPQESIQKYGKDGENGAVEIITGLEKNINIEKTTVPTPPLPPPTPKTPRPTKDIEKPIIILNGKRTQTTFEDLNKLDPNLIQSMNVLKGKSAVDKYGKDGENGAIEIITKENVDLLKSSSKNEQDRKEEVQSRKNEIQVRKDKIQSRKDEVQSRKDDPQARKDEVQARKDDLQARKDEIQAKIDAKQA